MIVIKDERNEQHRIRTCENCQKTKFVREVRAVGWMSESRGWFQLCFDCWGPQITWQERENSKIWVSPARRDEMQTYFFPTWKDEGGFKTGKLCFTRQEANEILSRVSGREKKVEARKLTWNEMMSTRQGLTPPETK